MVTGLGWGWIGALGAPGKVVTGVTPVTTAARVVADLAIAVHIPLTVAGARTVGSALGLVAAALLTGWFLLQSGRLGTTRAVGLSLLWFALLGPILWPWYLTWGLVTLAAVAEGWLRRVLVLLGVAAAFIGVTAVQGLFHSLVHAGVLQTILVVAALTAVTSMPLGLAPRASGPERRDTGDVGAERGGDLAGGGSGGHPRDPADADPPSPGPTADEARPAAGVGPSVPA